MLHLAVIQYNIFRKHKHVFAPVKGAAFMQIEQLQRLVTEQIKKTKDADLLDFVYKLLITEGSD